MRKALLIVLLILISISIANASIFDFFSGWFGSSPEIIASYASPLKVYPGQELTITAEVDSSRGILNAIARFNHESGFDEVPMTMIASSESTDRFTYTAKWEVHDTRHDKWYDTNIIFTDSKGETVEGIVNWQDPVVSHIAEEILPGNFSEGNFGFNGSLNVDSIRQKGSTTLTNSITGNAGSASNAYACSSDSYCEIYVMQPSSRNFITVDNGALCISSNNDCTHATSPSGAELYVQGVQTANKALCVKSDGAFGQCTTGVDGAGTCTCS